MTMEQPRDVVSASPISAPEFNPNERAPGEPTRVFLVDDDDDFREAVGAELSEHGYTIANFGDGEGLLRFIADGNTADVIVLDWRLRTTTGIDLLPQLRRRGVNVPVIFLTGIATPEHEQLALDHGALDFVDKSRGVPILARRIALILESHRARTVAKLPTDELVRGDLVLRPSVSRASWKGTDVGLTVTEFNIVHKLAADDGDFVTYRTIYDCVHWRGFVAGSGDEGFRTNVRSSIKRIRAKFVAIDSEFAEIENFPAFGYRWRSRPTVGS